HSKMIAIIRLIINSNIEFTGALNREDGKFSLVQRQLTTRARPWKPPLSSKIDTWAQGVWYDFKIQLAPDAAKLWINGKLQDQKSGIKVDKVNAIYLGRQWRSFGAFDELKIYDGKKDL
ncbi:MAG: hypothetical protein PHV82_18815, partial [Victivallaceae bacterium]|nr:hypothetical protein [Victivallaceae bacterium]